MAWGELHTYGQQARAFADGAEQVVFQFGEIQLHFTASEAIAVADRLRDAAKASQEDNRGRRFLQAAAADFEPFGKVPA